KQVVGQVGGAGIHVAEQPLADGQFFLSFHGRTLGRIPLARQCRRRHHAATLRGPFMAVKPIEDVRQISALTYGFIASKALFAALDLDLFTRIAQGTTTLEALAKATGTAANRLRTLLTTLKTTGLVSEVDGRFVNAPATATYLVAGAPGDFRDYIRIVNG